MSRSININYRTPDNETTDIEIRAPYDLLGTQQTSMRFWSLPIWKEVGVTRLAELGHTAQGICALLQSCEAGRLRKTVALLAKLDVPLPGELCRVFMPVDHHLHAKWSMATDLNGHVPPLGVDDVERIVIDPRRPLREVQSVITKAADVPHAIRSAAHRDAEHTGELRIERPMRCHLQMHAAVLLAGDIDHRHVVLLRPGGRSLPITTRQRRPLTIIQNNSTAAKAALASELVSEAA